MQAFEYILSLTALLFVMVLLGYALRAGRSGPNPCRTRWRGSCSRSRFQHSCSD